MARTYKSLAQSHICKIHCECLGSSEGSSHCNVNYFNICFNNRLSLRKMNVINNNNHYDKKG